MNKQVDDCPIYCGSTYRDRASPSTIVRIDEVASEYGNSLMRIVVFYLVSGHVQSPFYLSTERFREKFAIVDKEQV